ncbi:MAG: methionyl-tRNA formyltransferase [Vicinamibacteria bacterium]|nr:methionyl-tRNA formyltransferase [Vicinamibacteria bacterium]
MVTHAPLRVVFFGTPDFAVPTLDGLLASRHRVVGVVTQPDRPSGRGHQVTASPVKSLALERGVPVLQPEKMRDEMFLGALRALDADLGVVAAYGRILTDAILAIPRLGMVNVHASLLPRWRGAAPIHRAILAGDTETGVTIMRVVRELDAGPTMATLREPIGPSQTTGDVERILVTRGALLLAEIVERMAEGPVPEEPQPPTGVTYADRITKADSPIFWWRPAGEIHNQVRALNPWPLASTSLDGARLLVVSTEAGAEAAPAGALPGTTLTAHGDRFIVAAGHGTVQLLTVKPEGKRAMAAREFLAGHRVSPGAVLG